MGWLSAVLAVIEAVPSFVSLIEQVVAAIKNHPSGTAAGVAAVKAHMDKFSA